jgi:hypothetical protein
MVGDACHDSMVFASVIPMTDTDAELIAQAHKAAPLYGNDWGVLLIKMAVALKRHNAPLPDLSPGKRDAALIARLRKEAARGVDGETGAECCYAPKWTCCDPQVLIEAAAALARHSAPLPKAVAGLVEPSSTAFASFEHIDELSTEIERLTQERDCFAEQAAAHNNRDADMQEIMRINNEQKARAETAEARVREQENYKREAETCIFRQIEQISGLKAERDAIRAATIEECAKICDTYPWAAAVIRALTKEPAS